MSVWRWRWSDCKGKGIGLSWVSVEKGELCGQKGEDGWRGRGGRGEEETMNCTWHEPEVQMSEREESRVPQFLWVTC